MNKLIYTTAAAALIVAAGAANAADVKTGAKAEVGIGAAVSNTASAAAEKTTEGVNSIKGSYHQNMADSNAESAKENLANGDFAAAATDAKDAATHQSEAVTAKTKAAADKSSASKHWAKAKAAVSTSATTK